MTKGQMEQALKDVELIEKDFGRSLTDEEADLVVEKGFKALLDKFEMSDLDYKTMRRCFRLISAGFTETDGYDLELEANNYSALDVFKSLVNDLEAVAEEKAKRYRIGVGDDYKTVTKINLNETTEDAGYDEKKDDLDKYFTPESKKEAADAEPSYKPENDKELNDRFDSDHIKNLFLGKPTQLTTDELTKVLRFLFTQKNYSLSMINDEFTLKF